MRTSDFDFDLPPGLIAQTPALERDQSRLLVLHRSSGRTEHRQFRDLLDYLRAGDVLVLNNSRVIPARLRGVNARTGGQFDVLLLEENAPNDWWVMLRPGRRARVGTQIVFHDSHGRSRQVQALVSETNAEGHRRLRFQITPPLVPASSAAGSACVAPAVPPQITSNIAALLEVFGEIPLPPYIVRADATQMDLDRDRYQTVFAQSPGSVAAPTAGLHFTESLLDGIRARGVEVCFLTLHVGLGTFAPVKTETVAAHVMHEERYSLSEETAQHINAAKREGRRVVAVGTTTLRVLESVAGRTARPVVEPRPTNLDPQSTVPATVIPGSGRTRLFIHPPYDFRVVDSLLTNFHLPRSTLLMLVSAFAAPMRTGGGERVLSAYAEAIRERYRFFSYGDAMLLL